MFAQRKVNKINQEIDKVMSEIINTIEDQTDTLINQGLLVMILENRVKQFNDEIDNLIEYYSNLMNDQSNKIEECSKVEIVIYSNVISRLKKLKGE